MWHKHDRQMESGLFEAILFRGQLNCDWKTHLKVKSWGKRWRNRPFWDQTAPIHDLIAAVSADNSKTRTNLPQEKGLWIWESFQKIWKLCPKRYFIRFLRNTLTKIFSLAKLVNVKWRPIANCWPTMTLLFLIFEWVQGWERNFDGKWEILLFI